MKQISRFPHKIECAILCCRYEEDFDEYTFPAYMNHTVINFCDEYFSINDLNPDKFLVEKAKAKKIIRLLKSSKNSKGSIELLKILIGSDKKICYDLLKIWESDKGEIFFESTNSKYYFKFIDYGFKIIGCEDHDMCEHESYESFVTLAAMRKEQFLHF